MKKNCVCKSEETCEKCMKKTEEAPTPKEENDKKIPEKKEPDMKKGMNFNQLREIEGLHKSEELVKSKMDALIKTGNKDLIAKTLEKIKGLK